MLEATMVFSISVFSENHHYTAQSDHTHTHIHNNEERKKEKKQEKDEQYIYQEHQANAAAAIHCCVAAREFFALSAYCA